MKYSHLNILVFAALLALLASPSFATPPTENLRWKDPVIASIVFPAGNYPNKEGQFEIEVFCEAVYDIKKLSIDIISTKDIMFDKKLPHFKGPLRKGELKIWRIKGTVTKLDPNDNFPESINLIVKYRFPYKSILKDFKKHNPGNISQLKKRLKKMKGKTATIMRPFAIEIPTKIK